MTDPDLWQSEDGDDLSTFRHEPHRSREKVPFYGRFIEPASLSEQFRTLPGMLAILALFGFTAWRALDDRNPFLHAMGWPFLFIEAFLVFINIRGVVLAYRRDRSHRKRR